MKNFKNPENNSVHSLEDSDDEQFLIDRGFIPITESEANDLLAPSLAELKELRKAEISQEADSLINAQMPSDPRQRDKMMRKVMSMIDKQANRGQGRNPMLDDLAEKSDYADLIENEEETAHAAIDTAITQTEIDAVTLTQPPLPGS